MDSRKNKWEPVHYAIVPLMLSCGISTFALALLLKQTGLADSANLSVLITIPAMALNSAAFCLMAFMMPMNRDIVSATSRLDWQVWRIAAGLVALIPICGLLTALWFPWTPQHTIFALIFAYAAGFFLVAHTKVGLLPPEPAKTEQPVAPPPPKNRTMHLKVVDESGTEHWLH